MTESNPKATVGRRGFLKLAATGSVAAGLPVASVSAQAAVSASAPPGRLAVPADEVDPTPADPSVVFDRVGSDFMVDVIKALDIEYVAANCGSSFRSLQESLTVYGKNTAPEFLTCLHEEASAAMAHGYSKIENKPLAIIVHNTVGLQHASMGIFNAFCDRAPMLIFSGNTADATERRGGAEWYHSDTDAASMVRTFTKWDDEPVTLRHFAESTVRAYNIATTVPMGPTVVSVDKGLQERPSTRGAEPAIPRTPRQAFPAADPAALEEVAELLVRAEEPLLVADRLARTQAGMDRMVELAELLQAPVIGTGGRTSFPSLHPLNQIGGSAVIAAADVIVGLELADFWSTVSDLRDKPHPIETRVARPDAKLVSIGVSDLFMKAGPQTIQRYQEVDLSIAADGETTLPHLIEAVRRRLPNARRDAIEARGRRFSESKQRWLDRYWREAGYGWDASPVSVPRLSAEIWEVIKDKDWCLAHSPRNFTNAWNKTRTYHDLGRSGASGVGYGAPASVGAALANRKHGRFTVTIQPDGDLMYSPGVLWTAAHHKIPILFVMHNNRAYHQEVMHLQRMASEHNRGMVDCTIGTTIDNPNIDFAKLANSMGVYAQGPITDPKNLGPALRRAVAVVERGEPALLDVVCQPR